MKVTIVHLAIAAISFGTTVAVPADNRASTSPAPTEVIEIMDMDTSGVKNTCKLWKDKNKSLHTRLKVKEADLKKCLDGRNASEARIKTFGVRVDDDNDWLERCEEQIDVLKKENFKLRKFCSCRPVKIDPPSAA
ncbi:hypothetical protein BJ170DRAFT_617823 [Xylariales sp. AK1849]|nr:hypothetical protein BJ170DRAFT_617823 [Xylariales sp. AK1849]